MDIEFSFYADGLRYVIVYGKYHGNDLKEGDVLVVEGSEKERYKVFEVPLTKNEKGKENHLDMGIRPDPIGEWMQKNIGTRSKKQRRIIEEKLLKDISGTLSGKKLIKLDE
ncbi:MAG: hypothetical protein N2645_04645 [Clostridia bacterium]|nr:hypothetical protein [Clostridia bacterium]